MTAIRTAISQWKPIKQSYWPDDCQGACVCALPPSMLREAARRRPAAVRWRHAPAERLLASACGRGRAFESRRQMKLRTSTTSHIHARSSPRGGSEKESRRNCACVAVEEFALAYEFPGREAQLIGRRSTKIVHCLWHNGC